MKPIHLTPLILILLTLTTLANATELTTHVETYPQWTSGTLSIYILDFPQNEAIYTSNTIKIRIAVWGATPENPVQIQLNGETTATIENPGMYTYEWSLQGSHHLLIRCPNKIFQQAAFNIKAPPPPPPVIQLAEFTSKLEQQRTTILTTMLTAIIAGIPTGIWTKRKTKITTTWATLPMGAVTILGIRYLPTLYMLIPLGLSATLVYLLAREYADYIAISTVTEGSIETDVLPLDDEGNAITNIGPQHWRTGFIQTKTITLIDNRYPINFRFKGTLLRCITVDGTDNITETPDTIKITCSPTLARSLAESTAIEDLEDKLADARFRLVFMERAIRSLVSQTIQEMEQIIEETLLDQVETIDEAKQRVQTAVEQMKQTMETVSNPPPETPQVE